MESTPPSATAADYSGLKSELQNIAGIIERYPEHLKQRTFELLISAYLANGNANSKGSTPPQAQEALAVENKPVETAAGTVAHDRPVENEFSLASAEPETETVSSDLESRINANIESSTNMLRRRIRLRTMSPMRWQTSS